MELRTQQIQLKPNNKQATLFAKHAGYARVAYNFAVSAYRDGQECGDVPYYTAIKKEFNAVKYDKFSWCKELSQYASKNAIHNFGDAVTRCDKGHSQSPVYKKRSDRISYQADNGLGTVEVYKKRIKLPIIGWVRMCEELRWTGKVSKVVISRRNGKWFVSILVHCDTENYTEQAALFDDRQPIGLDVGINTLVTCSDGTVYPNPRPLKQYKRKLTRASRAFSRKVKYSKNWYKAKKKLAAVHYRVACIREDTHHKASTDIVSKASAIGIETLNISGLLKNRRLAKALSDSALSKFLTMLAYKAKRRKIPIKKAERFFASSKTCSGCGNKKKDLTLSDRQYHCPECGLNIDRDLNAAINLCPVH